MAAVSDRLQVTTNGPAYAKATARQAIIDPPSSDCRHKGLRRASNEGTLRAFRNADRFTTFKIFRQPGALRRRVAPG